MIGHSKAAYLYAVLQPIIISDVCGYWSRTKKTWDMPIMPLICNETLQLHTTLYRRHTVATVMSSWFTFSLWSASFFRWRI